MNTEKNGHNEHDEHGEHGEHARIHVFVNRQKVELSSTEITGEQLLVAAGFAGRDWDIFELQGEGDPSGGTPVGLDQKITVKNGDHFRVIPGNRNFGR